MKILVTAKYVSGAAYEGGSSRFMKCVIDALVSMGHEVIATDCPGQFVNERFDLIICSHYLREIRSNPAKKIVISHGLIPDERFHDGADRYISVSEEVHLRHLHDGFPSQVIGQPIVIREQKRPNNELKNILIIRREPVANDPFLFLSEKYNLKYSDLERPIEDQIEWADLCITLGRGVLESMAQGKPVLVADNRHYIGAYGDGYINRKNIYEAARCNFSGRRFKHTVTREWIESQLDKYDPDDSDFLYEYVCKKHNVLNIVQRYLQPFHGIKMEFGCMVNDIMRLDMCLRQSEIEGDINIIKMPEYATKGLNKLLDIIEEKDADIAVLAHQDMFFRKGWIDQVRAKISELPDSWIVSGIIGKDMEGNICGKIHDMRMPLHFATNHVYPCKASCFDECCIIVNMKSGFRFDEGLTGFDLYGTLCVLQAEEMGGTSWIIDAFAEHYCMRPFTWYPGKDFEDCFKWIHKRFPNATKIDTTVMGVEKKEKTLKDKILT